MDDFKIESVQELLALIHGLIPFVRALASLYLDNNNCIYLDSAGFSAWSFPEYSPHIYMERGWRIVWWCGGCVASVLGVHLEAHFPYSCANFLCQDLSQKPPQLMDGSECITVAEFSFV